MASATAQNSVAEFLDKIKASSLPVAKGEIVVIQSTESPYDGFKKLVDYNIQSAPVKDPQGKYTGFLDIRDLVSFVVFIDDDQKSDVPTDLKTLLLRGLKQFKIPVDGVTVTYLSRRNPFHSVDSNASLLTVVQLLAKGLHRIPVLNDKGDVMNIISQSTIVQHLAKHDFKETHKTVLEAKIGSRPVLSVLTSTPAIDVFRLMDKKKISGVAVVDGTGQLIGNTSGSDLKLFLRHPSMEILAKPIQWFLNVIRQEAIDIRSPTITCGSKDSVRFVVAKVAGTKVHRIFVADDECGYKPEAVISITDILRWILAQ